MGRAREGPLLSPTPSKYRDQTQRRQSRKGRGRHKANRKRLSGARPNQGKPMLPPLLQRRSRLETMADPLRRNHPLRDATLPPIEYPGRKALRSAHADPEKRKGRMGHHRNGHTHRKTPHPDLQPARRGPGRAGGSLSSPPLPPGPGGGHPEKDPLARGGRSPAHRTPSRTPF